jgi:RNA-binding protein
MVPLTNLQIRTLKSQAQKLKATLRVGKDGLSPKFFAALDEMLKHHPLLKVKFDYFKDEKKQLAPVLAEKSESHLVMRVGNVVVLYRPNPAAEKGALAESEQSKGAMN